MISMTSIVFSLAEGPVVLLKALAVFALREINLTKIESRPQLKWPLRVVDDSNNGSARYFDYLFYIDFDASMAEPRAQYALGHLQAVELWLVDKAVLPIENSVGGSIPRNYDLLLRHRLHIVGEVQLVVNHCLLGLPGVKTEELKIGVVSDAELTDLLRLAFSADTTNTVKRARELMSSVVPMQLVSQLPNIIMDILAEKCVGGISDAKKKLFWRNYL